MSEYADRTRENAGKVREVAEQIAAKPDADDSQILARSAVSLARESRRAAHSARKLSERLKKSWLSLTVENGVVTGPEK